MYISHYCKKFIAAADVKRHADQFPDALRGITCPYHLWANCGSVSAQTHTHVTALDCYKVDSIYVVTQVVRSRNIVSPL